MATTCGLGKASMRGRKHPLGKCAGGTGEWAIGHVGFHDSKRVWLSFSSDQGLHDGERVNMEIGFANLLETILDP